MSTTLVRSRSSPSRYPWASTTSSPVLESGEPDDPPHRSAAQDDCPARERAGSLARSRRHLDREDRDVVLRILLTEVDRRGHEARHDLVRRRSAAISQQLADPFLAELPFLVARLGEPVRVEQQRVTRRKLGERSGSPGRGQNRPRSVPGSRRTASTRPSARRSTGSGCPPKATVGRCRPARRGLTCTHWRTVQKRRPPRSGRTSLCR